LGRADLERPEHDRAADSEEGQRAALRIADFDVLNAV
jgi:hypothetical protein